MFNKGSLVLLTTLVGLLFYSFAIAQHIPLPSVAKISEQSIVNTSSSASCSKNTVARFDGNNDYLSYMAPGNQHLSKYTLSVMVKADKQEAMPLYTSENDADTNHFFIYFKQGHFYVGGPPDKFFYPNNNAQVVNKWATYTVTYDGTTLIMYVDGKEVNRKVGNFSIANSLRIGSSYSRTYDIKGDIDNVLVYNRALTTSEVAKLANKFVSMDGLLNFYGFDEMTPLANKVSATGKLTSTGNVAFVKDTATCVTLGNAAPKVTDDSFHILAETGSRELDILANDIDENKAELTITITDQSTLGGSATLVNNKLIYTAQDNYFGEDWFEYKVTDKHGLTSQTARAKVKLADIKTNTCSINQVARFDGNNDYLSYMAPGNQYLSKYTLSVMVKADKQEAMPLYTSENDADTNHFFIYFKQGHFYVGGPPDKFFYPNNNAQVVNKWATYTVTYDGTTLIMYVDGKEVNRKAGNFSIANSLRIGSSYSRTYDIKGDIDNVLVYNRVLTPADVQKLNDKYIDKNGLISLYDFDQGSELIDRATPSSTLAITGNVTFIKDNETCVNIGNEAPVAIADSFSVMQGLGSSGLSILSNDKDESLSSVNISITSQKPDTGTVTVSGQSVTYTPKANYVGADWFEYQLTDKYGLKSAIARVTLDVEKYKPKAGVATVSPRQNMLDGKKELITISHTTPNAKVWFRLHNLKTQHVTDLIEYTNPFYIYTSARIWAVVKGDDYRDSDPSIKDYVMCQQTDVCGTSHKEKHFHWWDKQTQKAVTKVKINQPVSINWEVENVRYCEESTSGQPDKKGRSPNGITPDYRFSQLGNISSRWQCFNSHGGQTFPTADSGSYRTLPLTVEKLDAPDLRHSQTGSTLTLNWDKVNYASHYQLQYQKAGESSWQTKSINGLSTSLALAAGDYNLKLSGCIPSTCNGVGNITTKTIKVADNPFVIKTLQWQTNPITVGETATLEWDIGNAVECFVDGRSQASSTNASHTTPAIYQAGTVDVTLACRKTAGGNKENIIIPQDKRLKVNKLTAPANLRKQ